ncbi:MAG: hypothetical protein H6559_34930 [Lewinellaceae bacterium]|nr:hypothetical protein [Lewinellaceae bacterium]
MINNFVPGALAQFDFPRGIALDTSLRRLYVVDFNNHAIRYVQLEPAMAEREPSTPTLRYYTPTPSANKLSSRWVKNKQPPCNRERCLGQAVHTERLPAGNAFPSTWIACRRGCTGCRFGRRGAARCE